VIRLRNEGAMLLAVALSFAFVGCASAVAQAKEQQTANDAPNKLRDPRELAPDSDLQEMRTPKRHFEDYQYEGTLQMVSYKLIEQGHKDLLLAEGHTWEVDHGADLLLHLVSARGALPEDLRNEWEAFSRTVREIGERLPARLRRRQAFNAAIEGVDDVNHVEFVEFNTGVGELLSMLESLGEQPYTELMDGWNLIASRNLGDTEELIAKDDYLSRWINSTLNSRFADLSSRTEAKIHKYRVGVQAFVHTPQGRQALAIPNFNSIAAETIEEARLPATDVDTGVARDAGTALETLSGKLSAVAGTGDGNSTLGDDAATRIAETASTLSKRASALRKLSSLTHARVDLDMAGVRVGDNVTIHLTLYEHMGGDVDDDKNYEVSERVTWKVRIVRSGWSFNVFPAAVFLRADQSKEGNSQRKNWRLNAAAIANWSYYTPNAQTGGARFINWLRPGFGIHLSAPTLEEENGVEFGIGLNLSLWDGFVNGGWGNDLNSGSRGDYYFIGLDLFEVLNKARTLAK